MLLFAAVTLRKLLVGRCLFAQNARTRRRLAITLDPISDCLDLFRIRLGKISKPGMAGRYDYAIRFDPSPIFAMGWLGFHRQSVNYRLIGWSCKVYQMVGVAVSILAYQYLHSKGKPFDRRPVSLGFAADYESTLVSGHYAVTLSGVANK